MVVVVVVVVVAVVVVVVRLYFPTVHIFRLDVVRTVGCAVKIK